MPGGRKRDESRDEAILDAALDVIAEVGYEAMTMDQVAARAKAGKATVYRRWPSKPALVVDAVHRLDATFVDVDDLPDTGTLRGDMVALTGLESLEQAGRRMAVMAGLASALVRDPALKAVSGVVAAGPWIEVNRRLIRRAVDRGEFPPPADLDLLSHVLPLMGGNYRQLAGRDPDEDLFIALLDGVLLPALRGG